MILSLASALGAALFYGAGTVLQAIGLRRAAESKVATLLPRLWTARLYAAGLALDGVGFLASIIALRGLPLFVVESVVASSVAVTAVLAVLFLGARLARSEIIALVAVAAGLVLLSASGGEGSGAALQGWSAWLLAGLVAPVLAFGVVSSRVRPSLGAPLLAVTAGLGFAGVGVAARTLILPQELWRLVLDPVTWALAAYAVIALVTFGLALQRGSVTTVAAVTFTVETVIPGVIGLAWLGDQVRPGMEGAGGLGFVLTLAGCILLARHSTESARDR